jgi:hypothetical protein
MPRFISGLALLQPTDAWARAEGTAEMVSALSDTSSPDGGPLLDPDDMLSVVDQYYVPAGQEPNRWAGTNEFNEVAEYLNQSDQIYSNGDENGLTLEVPFATDTALIRLITDQPHPQLGNGLLVTLQLPVDAEPADAVQPSWYNMLELISVTHFPLIGSWCVHPISENIHKLSHSSFIPNFLYMPGLVVNMALWMMGRARWARATFFPDIEDRPLEETLRERYQSFAEAIREEKKASEIQPISTSETPREIITADFPSVGELPISGGWGYSMEDACVIDKHDPVVDPGAPFDGVGVERVFVEKRIYEEMIIFRPEGHQFSGISWELQEQRTVHEGGRDYDHLVFEVKALRDADWEELKAEWEGPDGFMNPDFDREAHMRKKEEKTLTFTREYWFDITSFFSN